MAKLELSEGEVYATNGNASWTTSANQSTPITSGNGYGWTKPMRANYVVSLDNVDGNLSNNISAGICADNSSFTIKHMIP